MVFEVGVESDAFPARAQGCDHPEAVKELDKNGERGKGTLSGKLLAPRVGHITNVSSATHPGHPEITPDESSGYETKNGRVSRSTNRARPAGPEIWFRIVHSAVPSENCVLREAYREQEVAVAFGSIDIGVLTRRIEADQGVRVVPSACGILKPTGPKTPRVTELLRTAIEWQRQLDAGEVQNKTEIARREGITRARVTQIMGMLRLAPEIQEKILSIPDSTGHPALSERRLRSIETIADSANQVREFTRRFA